MNKSFYSIFKTFFKIGTLLLGGGYVILPLLQSELSDKKGWIDKDELSEYYALSQSIPGIIAANISIFTGYKLNGQNGAIAAISGLITPAFLAILILATLITQISDTSIFKSIFWGVGIGVIILIFIAVKEMWKKSVVDKFTCVVFIGAFILSACFKMNPALIVILSIIAGIVYRMKKPEILKFEEDEDNDIY